MEETLERSFRPTRGNSPDKAQRAQELRRAMTPEERILWRALRSVRAGGFAFRRQQVIDGFIVDFYCHLARLVIEVDGGIHDAQREYDVARDLVIAAHSIRVYRVSNDLVSERLPEVMQRICELLAGSVE